MTSQVSPIAGATPSPASAAAPAALSPAFEQALFAYLASDEVWALVKPQLDAALGRVTNPLLRATLSLFAEAALRAELSNLAQRK